MRESILLLSLLFFLLVLAVIGFIFARLLHPWLQCFLAGTPVPVFEIVAMRLRRMPVQRICEQRIKAGQAGVDLSVRELQQALIKGADIEKLVDALCLAKREQHQLTWHDLLETELNEGRRSEAEMTR